MIFTINEYYSSANTVFFDPSFNDNRRNTLPFVQFTDPPVQSVDNNIAFQTDIPDGEPGIYNTSSKIIRLKDTYYTLNNQNINVTTFAPNYPIRIYDNG